MTKFNYDNIVRVRSDALQKLRPGERAWIVGIATEDRRIGSHYDQFPPGNIYTIEYEDGESVDIHESDLEFDEGP